MTPQEQPDSQAGDSQDNKPASPPQSEIDDILNEFETDTFTDMPAKLAYLKSELSRLIEAEVMQARLNELKHRADDIIGRMYRLDRDYANKYISELEAGSGETKHGDL